MTTWADPRPSLFDSTLHKFNLLDTGSVLC